MRINNYFHTKLILCLAASLLSGPTSLAAGVLIPSQEASKKDLRPPAIDLLDHEGSPIEQDEVIDLIEQGVDVSLLDPRPSDIWTPTPTTLDQSTPNYPPDGATLNFDSVLSPSPQYIFRARVTTTDTAEDQQAFRLVMSLDQHGALARAALLRKLGYTLPAPKFYRSLTIRFQDIATRKLFLDELADKTETARTRWIKSLPENLPEVTLHDLVLEPGRISQPPYYWANLAKKDIQNRRALRALIIPFVLLDLPENVNLYSWEAGQIFSDHISLTHPFADSFNDITIDDARWIVRRIAKLSKAELAEIIAAGQYPGNIPSLLIEKFVARRNQLVRLFNLANELSTEAREYLYNSTISVGEDVKDGKLLRENYEGYAERFIYGDKESPLRTDDIVRFLMLEAVSNGLRHFTTKINEYLVLQGQSDISYQHFADLQKSYYQHLLENPGTPFIVPYKVWGGPTAGLDVNASRNIVTGTYYGSDSQLQLVDNIGVQAKVGYFYALDGIPKVLPSGSANLSVQRNYVHVRPVGSTKEAFNTDWKWLLVPTFMSDIAKLLNADPSLEPEQVNKSLDAFLSNFKEGEIVTITDSIALGVGAGASIPLAALLGANPLGVTTTVSLGAGAQAVVLRRTTITRTKDGIQVYLQRLKSGSLAFTLDAKIFLTILKSSYTMKTAAGSTNAYLIGDKPTEVDARRKMLISLKALFGSNNSELVEENYGHYLLNHNLDADIHNVKFLRWNWSGYNESHKVVIQPPADPENRYKPEDEQRTLFSHRIVKRKGINDYSFLSAILESFLPGYGFDQGKGGSNPANSFLGKSKWSSMTTEGEITGGRFHDDGAVAISEHHWQGWLLSKEDLFKIFDEIDGKITSEHLSIPLISRDQFSNLKQLQMYDVLSILYVYESGLKKVRELVATRDKKSDRALFNALVGLDDREAFISYCRGEIAKHWTSGEIVDDYMVNKELQAVLYGDGWFYQCLRPWMHKIFKLRKKQPKESTAQIKWTNELLQTFESNIAFDKFLNLIGSNNYLFQVRVNGFRSGQEVKDGPEGGDTYISSTLGTIDNQYGEGAFKEFIQKYKIMAYELYGRYYSEAD